MKKPYLSILIVLLLILNIAVLLLYYTDINDPTKKNTCKTLYIDTIDTFVKYQGKKIDCGIRLVNMEFDTLTFNDIIDDNFLVFYFNYLNCMPCVDSALCLFQEEIVNNKKIKCLILCCFKNEEELKLINKINNIKIPLYKIVNEGNNFILNNSTTPLLFLLNRNFEINYAIKIFPENINIIKDYLKIQTFYTFNH